MSKPFVIQNRHHKRLVEERIMRDLRALVVWEFENANGENYNMVSTIYNEMFGENAMASYWEQRREYLDQINKKRYEKEMEGIGIE